MTTDAMQMRAGGLVLSERRPWALVARYADQLTAAGLLALSLWIRIPGLAPASLYRDDAWQMLAARVHTWSQLVRIMQEAPGYTLMVHFWGEATGTSSLAAQFPSFVASTVAAPVFFYLLRRLNFSRLCAATSSTLLLSGVAAHFSDRVKPYAFDELIAVVLVFLAIRTVREPTRRRWAALAAVAAAGTAFSLSALPVTLGLPVAAGLGAGLHRHRRAVALATGAPAGVGAVLWFTFVHHNPGRAELHLFWASTLGGSVIHRAVATMTGVLTLGANLSPGFFVAPAAILAVALPVVVALLLVRRRWLGAVVASPILIAAGGQLAGVFPFDGGRVDLGLFPVAALALGVGLDLARERTAGAALRSSMSVAPVVLALLATYTATFGPMRYAFVEDTRALVQTELARHHPHDVVIVAPESVYGYALYATQPPQLVPSADSVTGFAVRIPSAPGILLLDPHLDGSESYYAASTSLRSLRVRDLRLVHADLARTAPSRVWLMGCWRDTEPSMLDRVITRLGYVAAERWTPASNYGCRLILFVHRATSRA
jgi:hypothetical protein